MTLKMKCRNCQFCHRLVGRFEKIRKSKLLFTKLPFRVPGALFLIGPLKKSWKTYFWLISRCPQGFFACVEYESDNHFSITSFCNRNLLRGAPWKKKLFLGINKRWQSYPLFSSLSVLKWARKMVCRHKCGLVWVLAENFCLVVCFWANWADKTLIVNWLVDWYKLLHYTLQKIIIEIILWL